MWQVVEYARDGEIDVAMFHTEKEAEIFVTLFQRRIPNTSLKVEKVKEPFVWEFAEQAMLDYLDRFPWRFGE